MQLALDLGQQATLTALRDRLRASAPPLVVRRTLDPVAQLVKSLLSGSTRDAVSWAAFLRLREAVGEEWGRLAGADPRAVARIVAAVTHAGRKAEWLCATIRLLGAPRERLDLGFLAALPLGEAMAWLQRLPGVGCKTAASVLNFSTLARPVLVVDRHVHRVATRFGLADARGAPADTHAALMALMGAPWSADALWELHWLMKPLGQRLCGFDRPRCGPCPLRSSCRTGSGAD